MNALKGQPKPAPETDEKGYMTEPSTWTPDVAEILAKEQDLDKLTDDQWKVLIHMRQHYLEFGIVPPIRMISRETGFTLRQMKKMFPGGLANSACKIAGIPADAIKPSFLYP